MYKNNDFEDIIKNRRSIRGYDDTVKINQEEMEQILTDAMRAPSSVNMQPWRFVVVASPEGKETLRPLVRFNTLQNDTSAAMIVIFGDVDAFENAEKIFGSAVEQGMMPADVKEKQMSALTPYYANTPREELERVAVIDGSLVAMQLMLVARAYGYDTNPIGGFERQKVAEAFGMDTERFVPVMIVSIGKATDAGYGSYRLSTEDTVFWK